MRLYEYEAKILFRRYKLPVLSNSVITQDTLEQLDKVTYPVVIKAQTFVGGRGKAGLVQVATGRTEALDKISSMLGKQHGGYVIDRVLAEQKISIAQELYLAMIVDRLEHKLLLIASEQGGIDVEELASTQPDKIVKFYFNPGANMPQFMARNIASNIGLQGLFLEPGSLIIQRLHDLFTGLDCKVAEINPLVITDQNQFYALDAKVDLDEDAMFRHPELRELGIVARHEVGELTEREKIAKRAGIPYVDLAGNIGVFPGGAGFGIAAIDLIQHYGGQPANFMDSGGAPTQDKLRIMLGLLLNNPRVKAIFGARFGGISRCDDWARAVVQYVIENRPTKPMIMRMAGNMEEQGRRILENAKTEHPDLFSKVIIYAYDTPIEEVIKETIRVANEV